MTRIRLCLTFFEILCLGLLLFFVREQSFFVQLILMGCVVGLVSLINFRGELARNQRGRQVNDRKLLLEKQRADLIAASISDGIILLRDQVIIYVNPIAERILGFPEGMQALGFKLDLQSLSGLTPGVEAISKAFTSSLPVEFLLEQNERKQHFLIQSCRISFDLKSDEERHLDYIEPNLMILAQDVTLVKEGQEAKVHFLGTLSHEVKTPVTSLTMAIHLLNKAKDQFSNVTHQNLISTCAQDIDRLRRLLDDLMTLSRLDIVAQRLELQKMDLGKLLSHAVQSFRSQAQEKGVQLSQSISVDGGSRGAGKSFLVTMDATKIAWALSNLLTNAMRHTPRGGKVVVFLDASNDWVEIRVKDTGPGIELQRQERIFEKFNPHYDLRVARSGAVGAGLAIAKEIVTAHGGEIWVASQPGSGAEFGFRLPMNPKEVRMGFKNSHFNDRSDQSKSEVENRL